MDKEKLLSRMMRLCSLSEHCRADIAARLAKAQTPHAEEILEILCKAGYIDDARYARAFARDKSSLEGWGSAKIKLTLLRKGISAEDADEALKEIDREAADNKLHSLVAAKWRALSKETEPAKKQAKLYRYALGRGYCYDEIRKEYDKLRRD